MIVITGGGTGGHLTIARVLKEELLKQNKKVMFIGSTNGQDRAWFEDDSDFITKYFFDTSGVVNKGFLGKFFSLLNIFKHTIKCFFIFKKYNVTKVISVGGYSSASASFAAVILRKDFYIHEQNAHLGSLNKLLQPFSKKFFCSYKFDFNNIVSTSYPIDNTFFKTRRVRENIKTIIFLGGSQGASAINNFAMKIASYLRDQDIKIIHQSGKHDLKSLEKFYKEQNIEVDLFAFSSELDSKISKSDFAISRSGASTLWELVANGVPSLFVPYPYAAGNHQYFNAKFLADKKLCFIKNERELSLQSFQEILKNADVKYMSEKLCKQIEDNGAKTIVDLL